MFPAAIGDCPDLLVENVSGEMTRNLRRMQVAPKGVSGLDQCNDQRIQRAIKAGAVLKATFSHSDASSRKPFLDILSSISLF
jgi:hypothetical protein